MNSIKNSLQLIIFSIINKNHLKKNHHWVEIQRPQRFWEQIRHDGYQFTALPTWLQPKITVERSEFDSIGTRVTLKLTLLQVAHAWREKAPKSDWPFFTRKKMEPNVIKYYILNVNNR